MEYKLTVTKMEKNPKWGGGKRDVYDRSPEEPEYTAYHDALIVTLKEEEFVAIKKAVIEVIK